MTELKSCPFCGDVPTMAWNYGYECDGQRRQLWAVFHNCAAGHGYSESGAIDAWNTRASQGQSA